MNLLEIPAPAGARPATRTYTLAEGETPCRGCGGPVTQRALGRPREWCVNCRPPRVKRPPRPRCTAPEPEILPFVAAAAKGEILVNRRRRAR